MTNYPCDYCGDSYDPEIQGHYDKNTYLKFCTLECEVNYDNLIGLPRDYNRHDDHKVREKNHPWLPTFKPIN